MSAAKVCPQCGEEYELDQRFCPRDGAALRTQGGGDLVGLVIAERYHVLRKLGEGGMGQVYLAEHVRMGRKSAVKVMSPAMAQDSDAISRFNREASNAARIAHPHVAAIYDFGETSDGLIYLAMEFVDGEPLTRIIERHGALAPARVAAIISQAADALHDAHEMGIVHRDLKPDNIMVARNRDGTDNVKLVDFGIAKAMQGDAQKVTKTGLVVGTPEFMSPEQLAGDRLDGRSDLYSLALVAFNMLTGTLPFPSETVQEAMVMRLTDRPRTLAEMRAGVEWPAEVQAVFDRALARDVSARYQRSRDFGRELERALSMMPAPPETEAGTQVLDTAALPATRVPAGQGAATVRLDAGAATAPGGGRRTPMLAAAALLVVALAGGGYALLGARGDGAAGAPPTGADSSALAAPGSGATPAGDLAVATPRPAAAADAATRNGAGGAQLMARPLDRGAGSRRATPDAADGSSGAASRTPAEPAETRPTVDVAAELAALDRIVNTAQSTADDFRSAVARAGRLLPSLTSRSDSVHARLRRAQAHLSLENAEAACTEVRGLERIASGSTPRLRSEVQSLAQTLNDTGICP